MKDLTGILSGGPLTGKELLQKSGCRPLEIWRQCNRSPGIIMNITGNRYLRLDKKITGYGRLSPSILREFLTYTIVGLSQDKALVEKKAAALSQEIEDISTSKMELAQSIIDHIISGHHHPEKLRQKISCIIAGDVVYNMAHAENRPESSTGEVIRGSDLDIIIVTENAGTSLAEELDQKIWEQKYYYMKNPAYREELDYIIKDMEKVKQQLSFDSFKHMVASKILDEGKFLAGSYSMFERIKSLIIQFEIPRKLKIMEQRAARDRQMAIRLLLDENSNMSDQKYSRLFFTTEEADEIY